MELATVQRLNALNRAFYDRHAENFADSRPRLNPGVKQILARVPLGVRVLELGCGDGKTARWLAAHAAPAFYLGLDYSPAMLDRAREYTMQDSASSFIIHNSSFVLSDFTSDTWQQVLPDGLFNGVLAFAVFHHLPGYATRVRLMHDLAARLAPDGVLVMSNWQFARSERLRQRIVPWSVLNLSATDVEPGDHLLSWERAGRRALRYVHLVAEAEARQLAESAGLSVTEIFSADGVTGQLAEYVVSVKRAI